MAKDLFSNQSEAYARYRPEYPKELYDHILKYVNKRDRVWDCATGNGQAAVYLSEIFTQVEATDLSESQLAHAAVRPNIHYQPSPAESTPFGDDSFDLITIATAYHWLDWDAFYKEATRVGKQGAPVAAWAYNVLKSSYQSIDLLLERFHFETLGEFWDPERKLVTDAYRTVRFPFEPLPEAEFEISCSWDIEALMGYIATWSAVQNYIRKTGTSPLPQFKTELTTAWPAEQTLTFSFPLFLRLGRIIK